MAVNSVGSGSNLAQVQSQPSVSDASSTHKKHKPDDGSSAQPALPQPTVNTSGQTVGSIINVKA